MRTPLFVALCSDPDWGGRWSSLSDILMLLHVVLADVRLGSYDYLYRDNCLESSVDTCKFSKYSGRCYYSNRVIALGEVLALVSLMLAYSYGLHMLFLLVLVVHLFFIRKLVMFC